MVVRIGSSCGSGLVCYKMSLIIERKQTLGKERKERSAILDHSSLSSATVGIFFQLEGEGWRRGFSKRANSPLLTARSAENASIALQSTHMCGERLDSSIGFVFVSFHWKTVREVSPWHIAAWRRYSIQ